MGNVERERDPTPPAEKASVLLELRARGKGWQSLGGGDPLGRERQDPALILVPRGPPRCHPQFLAAMTTDKATPPSAMAVAPKSHFQGMDCGAEHGDVRGCARGRGHVSPCLPDRTAQKGSAVSAVPGGGQRVPPADRASRGAAVSKVRTLQLARPGSGGHGQQHGLLSAFSGHRSQSTAPCSQRDRWTDTARPHPAREQGCVPAVPLTHPLWIPKPSCFTPHLPGAQLTQGSLSLHFLGVLAVLGFPSIFLYISVSTFLWSACFFTSLESSAWMVWGGQRGVISPAPPLPAREGTWHPLQVPPPPLRCAGTSWKGLETAEGAIRPRPAPLPNAMDGTSLAWDTWSTAPPSFLAARATPSLAAGSRAQGLMPDIRKGILSFNRDRKSVCLEDRHDPALPLLVWKQAGKTGLKLSLVRSGIAARPVACPHLPCWGRKRLQALRGAHKAPQKQQEAPGSRAGQGGRKTTWWPWWHGHAVPSAGGHIPGTLALPARATPGKAASNTKIWMSGGQNAPARSSMGLHNHEHPTLLPEHFQRVGRRDVTDSLAGGR